MSINLKAVMGRRVFFLAAVSACAVLIASISTETNVEAQSKFSTFPDIRSGSARGIVRPYSEATLATDLSARVKLISFREGEKFKKGDVLIAFDCKRYMAQLSAAKAEYRAQKVTYKSNLRLRKHSAIGRNEVEIALAGMEKAEAGVQELKAQTSMCKIHAPYDGRVVERKINEHEYSGPGVPLMRILNDSVLEIKVLVPSVWLSWIRTNTKFSFKVDETGLEYSANVKSIGSEVDPVSQTIAINGEFDNVPLEVLAGMSGSAVFEPNKKTALIK